MQSVNVALDNRSYDIKLGAGLLRDVARLLGPYCRAGKIIIVTDEHVALAIGDRIKTALQSSGVAVSMIILPPGEGTKDWSILARLCDSLLDLGIERSHHIVALGGGVIGDLVGFAASILKRGCHFIQIPTSLLAQVDSSVGGKTAINTKAGKNLVGSFHQPSLVLIDPEVLDSLPEREMRAGYAEIVKYGLLGDFAFFEWCEQNGSAVLRGDRDAQLYAIETSVRAKATIVAADELELNDKRALLNLGHTFGHALEADTGFSDRLLHGEAVAAGMALAFRFAADQGHCARQDAARVKAHIEAVGLPYDLSTAGVKADGETLLGHMMHDKKMSAGVLPFILPRAIGDAYVDKTVARTDVIAFLDRERSSL